MSDFKSMLPDLKELSSMGTKLFNGIKNSVNEIVQDYKLKRAQEEAQVAPKENVVSSEPVVTTSVTPPIKDDVSPVEPTPPIVTPVENPDGTPMEPTDSVTKKTTKKTDM
jgi:hypothetical protein